MMNPFSRRGTLSDFAEAIGPELRAIPTPEPSPELLDRILASRAAGVRVILPDGTAPRSVATRRAIIAVAIAVVAMLAIIPAVERLSARRDDVVSPLAFAARDAFAETSGRIEAPGLPALVLDRPTAIRPMTLEFSRRQLDAKGQVIASARDTVVTTAAAADGADAWRIASTVHDLWAEQNRTHHETLYVARTDLRPLTREVHVSPYSRFARINVEQRFVGDSVTGRMTTDAPSIGSGRVFARRLRPAFGPYIAGGFTPLALMATTVTAQWARSASLLGWAVLPQDVFVPVELRVAGSERVQVPAGTFDCWRVSIAYRGRSITSWIRKSDGLSVRVLDSLEAEGGKTQEINLARIVE